MSRVSDEERENMMDTQIEMGQDDEVQRFEIDENRHLMDKIPKKINKKWSSMLGKACVLSVAGILFILMLVELWSDYGTAISARTLFPPKLHNVFETCPTNPSQNTQLTKSFNALACDWNQNMTTSILSCNGSLPQHPLVLPFGANSKRYQLQVANEALTIAWQEKVESCIRLLIWSI